MINKEYIHIKNGDIYTVILLANENSDKWKTQVIYKDSKNNIWARPISEFIEKFKEIDVSLIMINKYLADQKNELTL